MEILEYGKENKDKIILIHGFETPYQIWERYIEHYKNSFHIIVPILQGHNPKEKDDFISFEQSAKDIEDYYISRYGQNVFAIYGMSMGGVLTAKLWENGNLHIDKVILESSPLISCNRIMTSMMTKQYLMLTHKTQARDKKIVAQAVKSIIPEDKLDEFFEMMDNISDTTIINCIGQIGKYKLPSNINTPNTEVYYYYGTKINELLAKKTAKYIRKNYPTSKVKCFEGKGHCEDSILNPSVMIEELDKVLGVQK
ncbi:MAG: alpha/beta hydrolase [Clostridia bacterium]|nr:alpha/beta hydrolase [Clostridia bacterium]